MELKFRVRNFSKLKIILKKNNARFVENVTENYDYLKGNKKLKKVKGRFYLGSVKRKGKFFELRHRKIGKKKYEEIRKNYRVLKSVRNKRRIYKLNNSEISLNQVKEGRFVIFEGNKRNIEKLAKKLGLKKHVTKTFGKIK